MSKDAEEEYWDDITRETWVKATITRTGLLCALMMGIHYLTLTVTAPYTRNAFFVSNKHLAFMFAFGSLASSAFLIPSRQIGQKIGFDKILVCFCLPLVIGFVLCSVASSFVVFFIGFVLICIPTGTIGMHQVELLTIHETDSVKRNLAARVEISIVLCVLISPLLGGIMYEFASPKFPFWAGVVASTLLTFAMFLFLYGDYDTFRREYDLRTDSDIISDDDDSATSDTYLTYSESTWERVLMWLQIIILCTIHFFIIGIICLYIFFWVLLNNEFTHAGYSISAMQISVAHGCAVLSVGLNAVFDFWGLNNYVLLLLAYSMILCAFVMLHMSWNVTTSWVFSIMVFGLRGWWGPPAASIITSTATPDVVELANTLYFSMIQCSMVVFPIVFGVTDWTFAEFGIICSGVCLGLTVCLILLRSVSQK